MKIWITSILLLLTSVIHAQTAQEWINQKKTQIKYLISQIAALQVYTSYAEKGMNIAKNGLEAISNIKKGDFSLHENYFASLRNINPSIKFYWKIAGVISIESKLLRQSYKQIKLMANNKEINKDEGAYCISVFRSLINSCLSLTDQLSALITPGVFSLKDNERLQRIDHLYTDVATKDVFQQYFINEISRLSLQRFAEAKNITSSMAVFNIR